MPHAVSSTQPQQSRSLANRTGVMTSFQAPSALVDELQAAADQAGVKKSALIRRALRRELDRLQEGLR